MLNLKKGLALVLAAATALTFAPVANLGATVAANAAETTQTHNLIADDIDTTKLITAWPSDIKDAAGFGVTFNSVALAIPVKVESGHEYQVYDFQNISNLHYGDDSSVNPANKKTNNNDDYSPDYKTLKEVKNQQKVTDTNSDGKLYFEFEVTSVNGGSFKLKDASQSKENSYSDITVKVTNTSPVDKSDKTSAAQILTSTDGSNFTQADRTNGSTTGDEYDLTLNSSKNPYYLGVTLGDVTGWTGVKIDSDKAVGRTYSGAAQWVNPDDNTGKLNATQDGTHGVAITASSGSYTYAAGSDNGDKNPAAFFVNTAHDEQNTLYVDFYSKDQKLGTVELKYTVARSNHAIDWIKWNSEEYTSDAVPTWVSASGSTVAHGEAGWNKTGDDGYTLTIQNSVTPTDLKAYTHEMNPYDKKTATITVKSESENVVFISSDSKIAEVKADANQPYVATVTAKKAGSASITVYVGSTNNNKGKFYTLPIAVNENGNDTFDITDSRELLGNETENTINLDASDQTAANAVKDDVITFKSNGGLKFDKVSVAGDAITYEQQDGVVTIKSNKTESQLSQPAISTISMTSKTEADKPVMGQTKVVTVIVWAKPAAQFTVDPIYLSLGDPTQNAKVLKTNPDTFTNVSWSITKNTATTTSLSDDSNDAFTLTNNNGNKGDNTQQTARIIAKKYGTGEVKALVSETKDYRPTAKKATVTVGAGASADTEKADSAFKATDSIVTLEAGKTATVASSGAIGAITETSSDEKVATVKDGVITAVAPGSAIITLKDTGDAKVKAGTAQIFVHVAAASEETVAPAKVTGLKVKNKKGAKVSVTWDAQDSSILYRVYKKVGNGSWKAKNVTNAKATLDVKKGASVTVKVKAFRRDENGKAVWQDGNATKAKAFKTDKK